MHASRRLLIPAVALLIAALLPACAQEQLGRWSFTPATDSFSPAAVLDLRSLNEKTAGESGFVQRTPGGDFALGNGKPVRFWAVDEYIQNVDDPAALPHKARWLAKRGVNMVRAHCGLAPQGETSQITDVNQKEIDHTWRLVAEMKKQGVYATISPYWAIPVKTKASWNVPGPPGQDCAGLLFWDKTLQKGYKAWLRALYAPENPYTGIPLAKDPAVAIIQLQNEDSMLFWSMQGIKGPQLDQVRTLFGDWLKQKYGTLDKANQAWGGETPGPGDFQEKQGDEPAGGRMGIYIVWHWTIPQTGYRAKRLADQLAFFVETMRRFNSEMTDYLRKDLGCKQLVNAGNWRPADAVKLFDAERYSYAVDDVMAVNRYFTGAHEGKDNGWAIRPGDRFTNNSVLMDPRGMPTSVKQPVGYPFIVPETEWVAPTAYQAEGAFLTAAYQSLTGVDISYFFADGDQAEWQPPFIPLPWNPPTGKWQVATPVQLGQFPAAALLFRQGYVQRGRPVVHEERALDDIYERRSPLIAEEGGYDPNRDSGDLPPRSAVKSGVDPLAFLVGPVEVKYHGDPAKSTVADLTPYIDHAANRVKSITGEVAMDLAAGVCTVNAPKAQGAAGFLSKLGTIPLTDVTIRSGNPYAVVTVISLDGEPIRTSRKLLVQVGTIARPTGWEDKEAAWTSQDGKQSYRGREVVSTGKNPWQIVNADVTLTVRSAVLTKATLLDANFLPVQSVTATRRGPSLAVRLPPNTLYLVLQ